MAISWGILIVISVFIARWGKNVLGHWWYYLHATINIVCMLAAWSAFGIAVQMASGDDWKHSSVKNALGHAWTGLLIMITMPFQVCIGWYADRVYDKDRTEVPVWPDKVHWWIGRVIVLLAICNIFVGMKTLDVSQGYLAAFAVWVSVAGATYRIQATSRSYWRFNGFFVVPSADGTTKKPLNLQYYRVTFLLAILCLRPSWCVNLSNVFPSRVKGHRASKQISLN
jgi:hypothetical protein